jgi:hypothetical protein
MQNFTPAGLAKPQLAQCMLPLYSPGPSLASETRGKNCKVAEPEKFLLESKAPGRNPAPASIIKAEETLLTDVYPAIS